MHVCAYYALVQCLIDVLQTTQSEKATHNVRENTDLVSVDVRPNNNTGYYALRSIVEY
jgi:hypothetical protein